MAKPPETTELFRIHADTSPDQMGHVLAALARMNVTNIGYELVTEVATFRQKQSHDVSGEKFLAEWVMEHPTFRANEVIKHFEAGGRTAGTAYTAIRTLTEKDIIKKSSPGHYQRADVKALAPPATGRHEISNKDLVWKAVGNSKKITAAEVTKVFDEHKRPENTATSTLSKLVKDGELKRLDKGQYEVIGRKPHKRSGGAINFNVKHHEVSNKEFILKRIKGRSKVSVKEMEEVFVAEKRNRKSVSAVFSMLTKTTPPILTIVGPEKPGLYTVNKTPKPNGADTSVTETAHG